MRYNILMLVLVLELWGCGAPKRPSSENAKDAVGPIMYVPKGSVPALGTNRVLQIAVDTLRSDKHNVSGYACKSVGFGGGSPDPNISNKWLVRFASEPEATDSDVFVIVDDATGKAHLWRWSTP